MMSIVNAISHFTASHSESNDLLGLDDVKIICFHGLSCFKEEKIRIGSRL